MVDGEVRDDDQPAPIEVQLIWRRQGANAVIARDDISEDGMYVFSDLIDELEQYEVVLPPAPVNQTNQLAP